MSEPLSPEQEAKLRAGIGEWLGDVPGLLATLDAERAAHQRTREKAEALAKALEPFERWPTVYAYAVAMVAKLEHHKPKKGGREGWADDSPIWLLRRIREEAEELGAALTTPGKLREVIDEAADVGNIAMMVADAALDLLTPEPSFLAALRDWRGGGAEKCATCGKPATCVGRYEGAMDLTPACDSCCGHGNEDGYCERIRDARGGGK